MSKLRHCARVKYILERWLTVWNYTLVLWIIFRNYTLEWQISKGSKVVMQAMCCAQSLSCVPLFVTPGTGALQALLSVGIFQARILEWVVMPSSRRSSPPRDGTLVSRIAGRFFYHLSHQGSLMSTITAPQKEVRRALGNTLCCSSGCENFSSPANQNKHCSVSKATFLVLP